MGGEEAGYMIILRNKSFSRGPLLPPRKCRKQRRTTGAAEINSVAARRARQRAAVASLTESFSALLLYVNDEFPSLYPHAYPPMAYWWRPWLRLLWLPETDDRFRRKPTFRPAG